MKFGGTLAAALAALAAPVMAAVEDDEEPICADRPGKGTGTCTVLAGSVQVEVGLAHWGRDRQGDASSHALSIGGTAIALGLTERSHVQIDFSPFNRVRVSEGGASESASGFGDIGVKAKYRLTGDGSPVQVAVLPFMTIPTAKRSLGSGKVEGGIALPIEWEMGGWPLSVTLTPELALVADSDGRGRHLGTAQVIGIGAPLSRRLSVSAELWGGWDFDPQGTQRQYSVGGSAAYLLSGDIQLDAGADFGLNRNTPDVELYAGVALRF